MRKIKSVQKLGVLAAFVSSTGLFAASQLDSGMAGTHSAEAQFAQLCAGCHGDGGMGGDRAPALVNNRSLRGRSETQIHGIIRNGTPGGMPAFPLPEEQLRGLAHWVHLLNASAYDAKPEGDTATGERFFFGNGRCGTCHMVHGRGKTNGPDLSDTGRQLTLKEIEQTLIDPTSQIGTRSSATCPGWAFCPQEPWRVVNVHLRNGSVLRGFARSQGKHDLQLQTFDGRIHLLTESDYGDVSPEKLSFMPPLHASTEDRRDLLAYLSSLGGVAPGSLPSETDPPSQAAIDLVMHPKKGSWPSYNGNPHANRYSALDLISTQNVSRLQLGWSYTLPNSGLQTTPVVSDGIMYVTAPDRVCALDSSSGREIWCYTRAGNAGKTVASGGSRQPNRGVAIIGDRIFFASGDAHLLCLNRVTGGVMWDIKMPETAGRYESTSAPLVVGDLVICGISGGDTPLRGFLAAYKVTTGALVWRFWIVPQHGEPGSETWTGNALETGGGATWLTGSYDSETDTLFWATGNPYPATNGDSRVGANLYTNCVLALDPKTGKLRWYFQFTPHDLHDWDAAEPLVLVDATFQGRPRKLLLQANRNGFFYVLDRTNGEFLLARPFVKKLNWASGIGPDGRPQLLPANQTNRSGMKTCPAVRGATNWYSTSFNPSTRLFYVMAVEECSIYRKAQDGGYESDRDASSPGKRYLRAINLDDGKISWEIPQIGPPEANYSGVLSTAGDLVFYGETGGSFAALEAKTGRNLWHFNTGAHWKASPMTYIMRGKQYVAIAMGADILAFTLPEN
jgi:PQQ-dependent dehydrogenase (methanol/ethanol family)